MLIIPEEKSEVDISPTKQFNVAVGDAVFLQCINRLDVIASASFFVPTAR